MPALLIVLFATLPLAEIVIVLYVGQWLGLWPTVGLLLANSAAGVWLLRREGRRVIFAFREAVSMQQVPTVAVVNGTAVAVGAALLITPGFLTDAAGFVLLIPASRAGVVALARNFLWRRYRLS
jgi:UPF0716 protein FxsA